MGISGGRALQRSGVLRRRTIERPLLENPRRCVVHRIFDIFPIRSSSLRVLRILSKNFAEALADAQKKALYLYCAARQTERILKFNGQQFSMATFSYLLGFNAAERKDNGINRYNILFMFDKATNVTYFEFVYTCDGKRMR